MEGTKKGSTPTNVHILCSKERYSEWRSWVCSSPVWGRNVCCCHDWNAVLSYCTGLKISGHKAALIFERLTRRVGRPVARETYSSTGNKISQRRDENWLQLPVPVYHFSIYMSRSGTHEMADWAHFRCGATSYPGGNSMSCCCWLTLAASHGIYFVKKMDAVDLSVFETWILTEQNESSVPRLDLI
jgi:hypothetical protein